MSDGLNGGFWGAVMHRDWSAALANLQHILAMSVAIRPSWVTDRIVEGVLIALTTSGISVGAGYVLIVVRMDERVAALDRATNEVHGRIQRLEDRFTTNDQMIARELSGIRQELGRLDGRTEPRGGDRRPR